jgi:hypothetical protein
MKRLVAGALLLALSGAPSFAEAATRHEPAPAVVQTPRRQPVQPAPVAERPAAATDYAAREAAAPELGKFTGGGAGIYIGGSTLVIVLLVVIIVILV